MGIGQIIKNAAGAAVNKLKSAPTATPPPEGATTATAPAWETAGHALTPGADGATQGYHYPDIENPTDTAGNPNPFYIAKTIKGANGAETANPDYVEAAKVHAAFDALDQLHRTENPTIDFAKEYAGIAAEQKKNAEVKPRGNALSAFAIALGGGKQASDQYAATNKEADQGDADKASQQLQFKKSLVDAHVKQLVAAGDWAKALKQNELSAQLEAALAHQKQTTEHKFRMEENAQLIQGRTDAAKERGLAGIRAAQARAMAINGGLSKAQMEGYKKEIAAIAQQANTRINSLGITATEDEVAGIHDKAASEMDTAYMHWQSIGAGHPASEPAAAGKMVQMFKGGVPHGHPLSKAEFEKLGGAAGAEAGGYTFKLQ